MSYQALYRVWRPQTFDELVGQTMIANTLKNAVRTNQPNHAYLFTGSRGTGKTSTAKILAKAINCLNSSDGNPCNECELCLGITNDQISDVVEIDAASNNGVDEIRDLRDKVRYAATEAQYKVYIIDEVHMLTTGAFNALLKTLEEPPSQVIFILATTEPHRIPTTIISRTQRFDFQRIKEIDLIQQMRKILQAENIDYDEEALAVISRAANGGMRDSLSLLDQSISYALDDKVTKETALAVSGSLDQESYVDYVEALYDEQGEVALEILHQQLQSGKQASRFVEELILFSRDLLLTLHTSNNHTLLIDEQIEPIRNKIESEFYYLLIDQLSDAQRQMRLSTYPDLYLEMMTVQISKRILLNDSHSSDAISGVQNKITQPDPSLVLQMKQQIQKLEEQLLSVFQQIEQTTIKDSTASTNVNQEKVKRKRPTHLKTTYTKNLNSIYQILNVATRDHLQEINAQWQNIVNDLPTKERNLFNKTQPLAAGKGHVLISFERENFCGAVQGNKDLNNLLAIISQKYLETKATFSYILEKEWGEVRNNYRILWEQNQRQPIQLNIQESMKKNDIDIDAEDQNMDLEIDDKKTNQQKDNESSAVIQEPSPEETSEVVRKAIEIFGEANIEIKNE